MIPRSMFTQSQMRLTIFACRSPVWIAQMMMGKMRRGQGAPVEPPTPASAAQPEAKTETKPAESNGFFGKTWDWIKNWF